MPRSLAVFALFLTLVASRATADTRAFSVCTDFSTGSLDAVDLSTRVVTPDAAEIGSDAVARWYQGKLYVVNRYGGDNIQVIDPSAGYGTVRQFSVGNGTNPQDIAFLSGTKAYVSRYGASSIAIVDPSSGASLGGISLAPFADGDGLPEMARMVRVDRWLFVACQRLTGFVASNPSLVVVVDTQADTVFDVDPVTPGVQAIPLALRNPVTTFEFDRSRTRLLIGCAGNFGVLDGGVEAIDPVGLTDLGPVATEAGLGGDIADIAVRDAHHAYAIVSSGSANTLRAWDPASGDTLKTIYSIAGGFSLPDMEMDDRGELYVCRNDFIAPGLLVFDTATDALVAGPLSTGLPPVAVTFDHATDAVLAVSPAPVFVPLAVLTPPRPNPARSPVRLGLTLAAAGVTRTEVLDVAGRRIRVLTTGPMTSGVHELVWDLSDEAGRPVHAGVYMVRVMQGDRPLACARVAVVR
ncbi:MAG: FlgD immunoglobulin-like domain containing protein [Candidatus Eisenbacteria bacterium]